MVYNGPHKIVNAKKLADKIKTKCQSKNRIHKLKEMIEGEERCINSAQITIRKHQKEIRLLKEKFSNKEKEEKKSTKRKTG
jgi:hypothetical protein